MTDRAPTGFFDNVVDRTLANLRNVWREIATSTRGVLGGVQRSDLPDGDTAQLRGSCELVKVDPFVWFQDVLSRIGEQSMKALDDLLPHCWAAAQTQAPR